MDKDEKTTVAHDQWSGSDRAMEEVVDWDGNTVRVPGWHATIAHRGRTAAHESASKPEQGQPEGSVDEASENARHRRLAGYVEFRKEAERVARLADDGVSGKDLVWQLRQVKRYTPDKLKKDVTELIDSVTNGLRGPDAAAILRRLFYQAREELQK